MEDIKDIKILVIDDEKNILESIKMVLTYENYKVETAASGLDGIDLFKEIKPDIVLLDVKMPGFNGLDVLKNLKEINQFAEIIMISGHSGIEEAVEAARLGAFDFLEKPIARDKLILTIRNAAEKVRISLSLAMGFSRKSKVPTGGQIPQNARIKKYHCQSG